MQLLVARKIFTDSSTIGQFFIDGNPECYTLEDVVRAPGVKIWGKTAIPYGTYKVEMKFSPHFGRMMPHVMDVPGFEGILIHWGNTAAATDGCLLTGMTQSKNFIGHSREAFEKILPIIEKGCADGDCWITYAKAA